MKISVVLLCILVMACKRKTPSAPAEPAQPPLSLIGTWQLIAGTTIEKGDTTVKVYTKNRSFIKLINETHFAFLNHDLRKGTGPAASFSAGGGRYDLKDGVYTEHLAYRNDRAWEGHDFTFTVTLTNDTLTQRGTEQVEQAGINRINIEQYIRLPTSRSR